MNIFKTGPRFIKGYIETKKFTSIKKQAEALRAAGEEAYVIGETESGPQKGVELC